MSDSFFSNFNRLLSPRQARRFALLQLYFLVAGVLQVAGAGSVAPFVTLLSDPTILHRNPVAFRIFQFFGFQSDASALIGFAVLTVVLLALSNAVAAGGVWLTFRFSLGLGAELQRDLFSAYLQRPFALVARSNSSDLIATISQAASRFTFNVAQPLLVLLSQAFLILVVVALLAWYSPGMLGVVALLAGGGYVVIFAMVRRSLVRFGDLSWKAHQDKQRLLTEALGGLKEIRLTGSERRYFDRFSLVAVDGQRAEAVVGVLGDLPRFAIETVAFSALMGVAIYMLKQGVRTGDIVALLSVFAMTAYRVLPAAQAIFKSSAQIRSNLLVMRDILPDVLEGRRSHPIDDEPGLRADVPTERIRFCDVSFTYPGATRPALRHASFEVPRNSLVALVGHSGSGKSTAADVMLGLLDPESGGVYVGDKPVSDFKRTWQRQIGYVPQSIFLLDDSISANIAFGSPFGEDSDRLSRALELARLQDVVRNLPGGAHYRVGERGGLLSGGQRQRVGLARALYNDARVLVLDEATSALDGATEDEVLDTLLALRSHATIVMIAHRMSSIRAADRIVVMSEGTVVDQGTYWELNERCDLFQRLVRSAERVPGEIMGAPTLESGSIAG